MVDKHRLPKITDVNDPLARSIGRINFEIQRIQSNATKWKEKQHRWSSSNFVGYEKRSNSKTNQTKYGQRKRSESLVRAEDEVATRQGHDRKTDNAFLKRYNSEPFLKQANDEFSVHATSLKLNNRKDESKIPVSYNGLLPPVILDPKLSADNPQQAKLDTLKTIKMIRDFDNSRKTLAKKHPPEEKRNENLPNGCKTIRKPELKKLTNAEESVDKDKSVKRKGLLPKRRLSEQVDSYEVNRAGNDKTSPRRITIRTSKSCPTIVIHECGDNDASKEFWENTNDNKNVENDGEIGMVGESDLSVLRSRTTSLVACWKPKQSFVNDK